MTKSFSKIKPRNLATIVFFIVACMFLLPIISATPTVSVYYPNGTIAYAYSGLSQALNYTITNGQYCFYNYNSQNLSIPCIIGGNMSVSPFFKLGLVTGGTNPNDYGTEIVVNKAMNITALTKNPSSTVNSAYIKSADGGTIIATGVQVGNVFYFNQNLSAGTTYRLIGKNSGGQNLIGNTTAIALPYSTEYFNITNGINDGGAYNDQVWIWDNYTISSASSKNITFAAPTSLTMYANDSSGNVASSSSSWSYTLFSNSFTYTPLVGETSIDTIAMNFTYTSSQWSSISAKLIYNGTSYSTTQTGSGDSLLFSTNLNIPSITNGQNSQVNSFYWNVSLTNSTGTFYQQSAINTQTVTKTPNFVIGTGCTAGFSPAMFFNFHSEQNDTPINVSINYNLQYGINSTTISTFGNLTNVPNMTICLNNTQPVYTISFGQIQYSASGYNTRSFYIFNNTRVTSTTINNTLYSLDTPTAQYFTFTAKDNALNVYSGDYLSLMRWYPNLNQYNVVEMGLTDSSGSAIMSTQLNNVDYRVGVYYPNGTLIYLLPTTRLSCSVLPCLYPITVNSAIGDFTTVFGVQQGLSYNSSTQVFTFVWNDPSQLTSKMNLSVYQITGLNQNLICSSSSGGFTGVIACNVSGYNGTIQAEVWRSASPPQPIALLIETITQGLTGISSDIKLFFGVILGILLIAIGMAMGIYGVMMGIALAVITNLFIGTIDWLIASSVLALLIITYLVLKRVG